MSALFAFFGMPGHLELLIVAFVILLLFGHRLPSVMRSLGRGVVEFKRGIHGVEDELDESQKSVGHDQHKEPTA
jgi:sec-independent protein translocase protein TatA